MAEIAALPWNGYTVASTFSGCGGSSLGYKLAGFRVAYANEFVPAAQETYRANFPGTYLDTRDIRTVRPEELLSLLGLKRGELDVLDGSPPCASFSTAGKREKLWGKVKAYSDVEQRTDDLFYEYARLLEGLQPRVFVAENVSGLVKGTAKGYFLEILAALQACGYEVSAKLLDAQWLGVPQSRQRVIFIGVRRDLVERYDVHPAHPTPLPYRYTIREALPWITRAVHDTGGISNFSRGDVTHRPCPPITVGMNGINSLHYQVEGAPPPPSLESPDYIPPVEPECDITKFAIGREWDKMPGPGSQSDRYFQLVRPSLDKPCPTITQTAGIRGAAGVTHPLERRKFSIGELKRVCAFPDDFQVTGSYRERWERLGRAVPPVMMAHIAATVRDEVLARCHD